MRKYLRCAGSSSTSRTLCRLSALLNQTRQKHSCAVVRRGRHQLPPEYELMTAHGQRGYTPKLPRCDWHCMQTKEKHTLFLRCPRVRTLVQAAAAAAQRQESRTLKCPHQGSELQLLVTTATVWCVALHQDQQSDMCLFAVMVNWVATCPWHIW